MTPQARTILSITRKLLLLFLVIVWLASGITKLAALSTFQQVLSNHGVLSDRAIDWAWMVPVIELLLGGALLAGGSSERLRPAGFLGAVGSMLLLTSFIIYIGQVPPAIFRQVGCGCEGVISFVDYFGTPSQGVAIGIDVVLITVSLAASPQKKAPESRGLLEENN